MRPNARFSHRFRWYLFFQVQAIFCTAAIPIFLLITAYAFITRLLVSLIASLLRRDLKEIYSDNGMGYAIERVDIKPKCAVLIVTIFQGSLSLDTIHRQFERNIINYRDSNGLAPYAHLKDFWVPFLGFYFWKEDKNFKLANYVRTYDYNDPDLCLPVGSRCTVEDLERVTGSLLCHPFHKERSPWEMLMLPNYKTAEGTEACAVIFRIHHTLADGHSSQGLLLKVFESKVQGPTANFRKVSLFVQLCQIITMIIRLPWDLATIVFHYGDVANQWNLHGKKLSRKYFAYFADPIPVTRLKEICKSYGVTYNALVYSICCGVVTRMMKEAGHEVPKKLSVVIPLPLPNHPGGLVNHLKVTQFFVYPCDIIDPVQRLRHVSCQVKAANVFAPHAETFYYFSRTTAYFPIYIVKAFMGLQLQTLGMSSFCGPLDPVQAVASTKITETFGVFGRPAGCQGGASFQMISCAGKQHFNVVIDQNVLSGHRFPFKFSEYIQDEMEALMGSQDLC